MVKKMPTRRTSEDDDTKGGGILKALSIILKRCEEAGIRLAYPGEGGERAFRGWLVSDFLVQLLGWPPERVVLGERFDILLQDADGFPIATIETKTPYHKATRKDREDFEARLSGFGTLRHAYFTNGDEWERLDIFSPTGALEIRDRFYFNLEKGVAEEAEAFFTPLESHRYFGLGQDRHDMASTSRAHTFSKPWRLISTKRLGSSPRSLRKYSADFAAAKRARMQAHCDELVRTLV